MDGYIDLALTPEELEKDSGGVPIAESPKYPYGLSISLDEKTLDKLDVDHSDWEIGDILPAGVLLKITGKNESETQDGKKVCVNIQIVAMKGEDEDEEDEDEEEKQHLRKYGYIRTD